MNFYLAIRNESIPHICLGGIMSEVECIHIHTAYATHKGDCLMKRLNRTQNLIIFIESVQYTLKVIILRTWKKWPKKVNLKHYSKKYNT